MAVAFKTALGTGLATSSGTTIVITTTAAISIGDLVVVRWASDNLNATTPTATCADGGNTYTVLRQGAVNATAAAGVAGGFLATKATVARASGSTITVTLSGAVAHKCAIAESFTGVENTTRVAAVGATGTATAASAGATAAGVLSGDLVLGHIANETRGTITGDSDTTNGAWSTQVKHQSATSGSDATCVSVAGQYKIATAGGAQTYNVTAVGAEWVCQCVVLQASPEPSITQAAYRWYGEGTEAGATALATQDTAVVGDITNGDATGTLRIRLQSTTAVAVPAIDDFQLQYEKNTSGSWINVSAVTTNVSTYDSPNLTNAAATTNRLTGGTGSFVAGKVSEDSLMDDLGWAGNNFTELVYALKVKAADVAASDTLRFRVLRNGATATMTYSVTPTINIIQTLPAITQAAYRFYGDGTESGSTALAAQNTAASVDLTSAEGDVHLRVRLQSTNTANIPATDDWKLQYEKNVSGTWVDAGVAPVSFFDSTTLTDGATTTNRLTGGTGIFVAGKVAEFGIAANLGWSANNYTELLFSMTLNAVGFANGDTMRFRVLRNTVTTGMTYTATPTINVVKVAPVPPPVIGKYLDPSIGTASTPDPGIFPDPCTLVVAALGPPYHASNLHVLVSQFLASGGTDNCFAHRRFAGSGTTNTIISQDGGTSGTQPLGYFSAPTGSLERFAVAIRLNPTIQATPYTSPDGTNWTPGTQDNVGSPYSAWDSSLPVVVGAAAAGSLAWSGRIYMIELRTGLDPAAGTVLWRFNANDHVSGTSWVDQTGKTWTVTSASAIVIPALTWAGGSTATVGAVGVTGSFAAGAVTWSGSTATIGVAGLTGTMTAPVFVAQEGFRWRNDDGDEDGATWLAAQDTNTTLLVGTAGRLRALLDTSDDTTLTPTLYYRKTTDSVWFTDDFERADGALGANWAVLTGSGAPAINSGEMVGTVGSAAFNMAKWATAAPSADHSVELEIGAFGSAADSNGVELITRGDAASTSDTTIDGMLFAVEKQTATTMLVGIYTLTNGVPSASLAESTITIPSLPFTFKGASTGNTHKAYVNGTEIVSATNSTYPSNLRVGIDVYYITGTSPRVNKVTGLTASTWAPVPVGAGGGAPVYVAASANIVAGGEATTALLTAPAGKTTADFSVGRIWDDENGADMISIVVPPSGPAGVAAGLQGWYDASDAAAFIYSSGTFVSQWNDKSSNARHLTQATVANQPDRSGSQNGLAAVWFDGSDDGLLSAAFTMPQPFTVIAAIRWWGYPYVTLLGAVDDSFRLNYVTGTLRMEAGGAFETGLPYEGYAVLSAVYNGASSIVYRNGGIASPTGNPGSSGTTTGFKLGRVGGGGYYGQIYEVCLYNRVLTTTERQQIESYLGTKWAIAPQVWSPSVLPGLQAWYDAADGSTFSYSSGSVVSQWGDKSGNGRHLAQSNVSLQPSRGGSQNGYPVVVFDGNNHRLSSSTFTLSQPFTVVVACHWYGYPWWGGPVWATDGSWNINSASGPGISVHAGTTLNFNPPAAAYAGMHQWAFQFDGASSRVYEDGIASALINPGTAGTTSGVSTSMGNPFWGFICEIVIYNRVLTTEERQIIEKYLYDKWATSFSPALLPGGLTGLAMWWDFYDTGTITEAGGYQTGASRVEDKSGNNRYLEMPTAANRPIPFTRTINGKNALDFDGTNDSLSTAGVYNHDTPVTMFAVVQSDLASPATPRHIIGHYSGPTPAMYADTYWKIRGWDVVASTVAVNTSPHVLSAVMKPNTAVSQLWLDGTSIATGDSWSNAFASWIFIGQSYSGGDYWDGLIAEVLIYERELSTADRQTIEAYLKNKWATP